tara:strand:+ start:943 stop:1308 length:366 start_codon:yes stop_codon:yes gene_type:complete
MWSELEVRELISKCEALSERCEELEIKLDNVEEAMHPNEDEDSIEDLRFPKGVPSIDTHLCVGVSEDAYYHAYLEDSSKSLTIFYHNRVSNEFVEAETINLGTDYRALAIQMAYNWFELNS